MMQRIFTVLDRFDIPGKGLALTGVTEDDSLVIENGSTVIIKRADLPDIETRSLGFELMRNDWSPHKPKNMALLLPDNLKKEDVPEKSEVWSAARRKKF